MTKKTSISLITTCRNAAEMLPVTLRSIRQQTLFLDSMADFEYIIIDAASTDRTLEVLHEEASGLPVTIISEPDAGLYDGLAKGLLRSKGDVVGYINAGDYLFPTALEVIKQVFSDTSAAWITSYATSANKYGHPTQVALPFRFRKQFFEAGVYGSSLPLIQQESTFWRRDLMESLDWNKFRSLKLAGDFYLWQHFSKSFEPSILHSQIGAFCTHPGQLSEDYSKYADELRSLCRSASFPELLLAWVDYFLWKSPNLLKRRLGGGSHIVFDHVADKYVFMGK